MKAIARVVLVVAGVARLSAGQQPPAAPSAPGPASLPEGAQVRAILESARGAIWIGTHGDGIYRTDPSGTDHLTEADGLPDMFVRTIQQDRSGTVWISTRDGVCTYDDRKLTNVSNQLRLTRDEPFAADRWRLGDPTIWFGARDGVYQFNGRTFAFLPLPIAAADEETRAKQPGFNQTVYSVYCTLEDKAGNLWMGTDQRGIVRYDGKTFEWFTAKGLDRAAVRTMFMDRDGVLWFGNNGMGLFRYDGRELVNITEQHGLSSRDFVERSEVRATPGTMARVWSIQQDVAGHIWVATIDAGVWRFDGESFTNFGKKDGLNSDAVWTIAKRSDGTLVFGTDGAGVYRFDGRAFSRADREWFGR